MSFKSLSLIINTGKLILMERSIRITNIRWCDMTIQALRIHTLAYYAL